jgi:hypothetical protein
MVFDPKSTTDPLVWEFYVPVTTATDFALEFYDRITASADNVMTVTVYDSDDNATKLLDAESVTFTDNEDWNLYTSTACTPTDTGFCRVVLEALDGATTGDIGIDNIGLNPDVDDNYGNMDRWIEGLPPKFMTDSNINASSAFSN